MAFVLNGATTPKKILINGSTPVKVLTLNGIVVWRNEIYLWNNGNTGYTVNKRTYGGHGMNNASVWDFGGQTKEGLYNDRATAAAYVVENFSDWKKLEISYNCSLNSYGGVMVGYGQKFDTFDLTQPMGWANITPIEVGTGDMTLSNNTSGTRTFTADISGISGNRQVGLVCQSSSSVQATVSCSINWIKLS